MQIRRYFTNRRGETASDIAFRRVRISADGARSHFVFAPSTWPLSAIEAFAGHALLKFPVPAARRQLHESGIPHVLRRHRSLGEMDDLQKPVERLETDFRDAIGRVCGALARQGLDSGYFARQDDALAFQEELNALLIQRRGTLAPEIWQKVGVGWAYDMSPPPSQQPARSETYPLSSDAFLTRITADARRDHDAAALALGRSSLAETTKALKAALANGGPNPASNPPLKDALADAEDCGLPAAVAQRIIDECLGGDQSWPEADTHLDADSDVWSLLAEPEPYAAWMSDACSDASLEELALASFRGDAPGLNFEPASARHTLSGKALAPTGTTDDNGSAPFTPSAAIDLLSFTLPLRDDADTMPHLDIDGLVHTVRLLTIALDICIEASADEFISAATTRGLAVQPLNLSATVMSHGVGYGSVEGRALAATLSALVTATAIATSAKLADKVSSCSAFKANESAANIFLNNMESALLGRPVFLDSEDYGASAMYPHSAQHARILDAARGILGRAKADVARSGLRNMSLTGMPDDVHMAAMLATESGGMAPVHSLIRHRHLTPELDAHAIYKVVSPAVPAALRALHHEDASIDRMLDYMVGRGSLDGAPGVNHELLRERGFADEDISITERALATAGDIRSVFTPYVLGWDDVVTGDDILLRLGFSDWDVDHANLYCCGALTLEGSRDLPVEHLAVFDCDTPLGAIGTRHVGVTDRMRMAQAIQPFLTDGVALDLSLSPETDIDGIRDLYRLANAMGLAYIRLNRAGTDLSAPMEYDDILDALRTRHALDEDEDVADKVYVRSIESDEPCSVPVDGADQTAPLAIAISVGLKHGVPIEAFQDAFAALTQMDGPRVLNTALGTIADTFVAPGASSIGELSLHPLQEKSRDDRASHIDGAAHKPTASKTEVQELGTRTDTSVPSPSQAFGDTAFSPPSVSGQSRKE